MFTSTLIIAPTQKLQQETAEKKLGISFTTHPDLLIIDESPSISIEAVRNASIWLSSRPYASSKKTIVILSAERLTTPAQQALLKTLEEPPSYAQIVLTAKNIYALLPTIQSRCVTLKSEKVDEVPDVDELQKTIPSTYPEIFALSEELGKDREVALGWCLEMMRTLHLQTLKKPTPQRVTQLQAIQRTLHLLKRNVHTKLAIESMCFHAKRIDV